MGRTCVRFKALPPSGPVERLRSVLVKGDLQLSIGAGSVHDSAMSNRAPLHGFEIIFVFDSFPARCRRIDLVLFALTDGVAASRRQEPAGRLKGFM